MIEIRSNLNYYTNNQWRHKHVLTFLGQQFSQRILGGWLILVEPIYLHIFIFNYHY